MTFVLFFAVFLLAQLSGLWAGEPKVRIHSPRDGSRIVQEQSTILVSGKVSSEARGSNVDILFVLDVSGSTALYAGVDFGDGGSLRSGSSWGRPQVGIFGGGFGISGPLARDPRSSVLAAEVAAARRLLSQLNPETTRAGVITFGENARLVQPLTHDFEKVREALDEVFAGGPYGGTNMAAGIRLGIKELVGLGVSQRRADVVKVQFLLTDGFPTLPIGGGKRVTVEDTEFAISAARIAAKAGVKIHVFALGEEALSHPRAAVQVARESGGIFTPVVRPADILRVLETISAVGVDYIEVFNETTGQKASHLRLAADGFFSAAVPVVEGLNRIQVSARSSDGLFGRDSVAVHYQPGGKRSLELEVFLEKEKKLKIEVERLGKTGEELQREGIRSREESLRRSQESYPQGEVR